MTEQEIGGCIEQHGGKTAKMTEIHKMTKQPFKERAAIYLIGAYATGGWFCRAVNFLAKLIIKIRGPRC